ncbi:MAG: GAF domain-containing protein [Longimicrobiales bacterium]|jgi:GAF domain-containing protein|tara:strand:- start:501 stop:974 length:474 start_codon:yes stop_codon:yes gene_type:complete
MFDVNEVVGELQGLREEGYLSDALLRRAVRSIFSSEERFDWVGIYLLRSEDNALWLHNYLGDPTPHATIPVGEGVCGMAVANNENINVPDVTQNDNYLSCSPKVKSEMVVLIRGNDQIFGQIDIDSHQDAAFTDEDLAALEEVAGKLAEQMVQELTP